MWSKGLWLVLVILVAPMGAESKVSKKNSPTTTEIANQSIKVMLYTDKSGIDDRSFNASAWKGLTNFYGDTPEKPAKRGKFYDTLNTASDAIEPTLRTLSDGDYDLIIAPGITFATAVAKVAAEFPDQRYMIVDSVANSPHKNIASVVFAEHEGSFLAGLATALKAKEDGLTAPTFGFIGGVPGAVITRFEVGFIQGLRTIYPAAAVVDYYANEWARPDLAKVKAEQWFNNGVYAVFSAAGYTGSGAIQTAKEARKSGKNVWAIGVDSDQFAEGIYGNSGKSAVLTSSVKKVHIPVRQILEGLSQGKELVPVQTFGAKEGSVGLPEHNPNLSTQIISTVESYRQKIVSGALKVDRTVAEFSSPGHMGQGLKLQALDD